MTRMSVAPVLARTLLAGCALLYDPSGIATVATDAPRPDAALPVDAEVVVAADPPAADRHRPAGSCFLALSPNMRWRLPVRLYCTA